jgi:cytochrome c biogenesis protein CcmG/thiol:disulfide interchange protein DsbE
MKFLLPLIAVVGLFVLLGVGLGLNPREVPSPLIGKAAPAFSLSKLRSPDQVITESSLSEGVTLFNVWATWCLACRQEHDLLVGLKKAGVKIVGLNYKDERGPAIQWLDQRGDPYVSTVFDPDGKAGIEWGVYGVPETFVIDDQGIVRFKHIGPLTVQSIQEELVPLLKELRAEQSGEGYASR